MDPILTPLAVLLVRGISRTVDKAQSWLNAPSREEVERWRVQAAAESIRIRAEVAENRKMQLPESQVPDEVKAAYATAMKLWKGGRFRSPDREGAIKLIIFAAKHGHADAQRMARMQGIGF